MTYCYYQGKSIVVPLHVSEFRQDCLGNYTIPSHPLATYVLTRLDTRSKLSEGDGDKICETQKEAFFFLPF